MKERYIHKTIAVLSALLLCLGLSQCTEDGDKEITPTTIYGIWSLEAFIIQETTYTISEYVDVAVNNNPDLNPDSLSCELGMSIDIKKTEDIDVGDFSTFKYENSKCVKELWVTAPWVFKDNALKMIIRNSVLTLDFKDDKFLLNDRFFSGNNNNIIYIFGRQ